jgi:CBS domain-containing protein/PII-like signaling protein
MNEGTAHPGVCVRVYLNEGDTWHGQPLAEAILRRLRDAGCAGATVLRGWAGFGSHGQIHAARMVDTMPPLPLIVEWIDVPDRADHLLALVLPMIGEGMVVRYPVEIVQFTHRALRPLPESRRVGEVMTAPVATVPPATPLRELVSGLIDRARRTVLVVDAAGHLAGIVTNGDLVERGGLSARVHLLAALGTDVVRRELDALSVSPLTAADVMTRDVITATPEMTVRAAARLMVERRLKRLPVVDHQGRPVGIVSRFDLLRTMEPAGGPDPSRPLPRSPTGQAVAGDAAQGTGDGALDTVGAIAVRSVPTVAPTAPLSEVLDAVISTRLSRAVVVDAQGRPLGIISDAELLRRVDPAAREGVLAALTRRMPFAHAAPAGEEARRAADATQAADLMIADFVFVPASTPLPVAIDRMLQAKRKILPVVDGEGRLAGMVDRADALRAVARLDAGEADQGAPPDARAPRAPEGTP